MCNNSAVEYFKVLQGHAIITNREIKHVGNKVFKL